MAKEPIQNNQFSDETDVLALLKYFERGINKIFNFFASILKFFYSAFIYTLKAVLLNLKIIALVIVLSSIAGYALESFTPKKYEATMLVRTYFDSQYQLATNIDYYNALLSDKDFDALQSIFNIEEQLLEDILEFKIESGPETENERFLRYDNFIRKIDSVRAQDISFDDYIEGSEILERNFFKISVISKSKDIFPNLHEGIDKSFRNLYSIRKMEKRDSLIAVQKINLREAIAEIDSLQIVYINVLEEESAATKASINLGQGFPLTQEKSETKEFQLLNKEIELRERLRKLDEQMIEENVYFDVISSFQDVGNEYQEWSNRFMIIFPILGFLLLCFFYLFKKLTTYVKNYEG
ncbi:MAG: hypothetical protein HKN00_08300 [Flavobacteriaceae bacterium]|nr:hypothetical protein [Bacteroidia bacterium]MBT8286642.1 hypothetical protein [Bacteroidia bacterium]NNF75167.1 hypothetical protein [Flavobacteriaceae bacterium]NNK72183.1 hypothetical protein [Flavobacteriaceae bacterium]